jgi:ABC-type branched-subunit amino acid transport system substrate-binding protein
LYVDLPQAQATIALMNSVLTSWRAPSLVHSVAVPIAASDVSSQLTAAAQGSEAVIYAGTPAQMQQVALAAHNLGITVPIITAASYWNANSLKSNAATLEGYNSFNFYPTNDVKSAGNTTYLQAMTDVGQVDKASNEQAKSAWVAFDMFNTALKGATSFDRPSIMTAMNAVSNYDAGGLITPIGFTKPGPLPTFPRLQNTKYFWAKIKNATFVAGPNNSLEPIYGG